MKEFIELQSNDNKSVLRGLKQKIDNNSLKLSRIDRIVATSVSTVDTTYNRIVLDSLGSIIEYLKSNQKEKLIVPFSDSTKCFNFKAKLIFENKNAFVEVLERKYTDTLIHISTRERQKWKLFGIINTMFLGKKITKIEIFNDCGVSKTTIIDNSSATRRRNKK